MIENLVAQVVSCRVKLSTAEYIEYDTFEYDT